MKLFMNMLKMIIAPRLKGISLYTIDFLITIGYKQMEIHSTKRMFAMLLQSIFPNASPGLS